jgi:hypothetical protein
MEDLAQNIARKVVEDTKYFTAIVGLIGVVVGALLTILGKIVTDCLTRRAEKKRDEPRRTLLKQMLKDKRFPDGWRRLETLMHVIGADGATTKHLLLEIGARGSEDGQDLWGLAEDHPFKETR